MELGNLSLIALVFGQLLNSRIIPLALTVGLIAYIVFNLIGVRIMKGGENK